MKDNFFVVDSYKLLPEGLGKTVVAIGNFDGLHLGHQFVLKTAAEKLGDYPFLVFTFDPHPRAYFKKDQNFCNILQASQKLNILNYLGINGVIQQSFDKEFAALSVEAFIEEVLQQKLQAQIIVVGSDFKFGANRAGDINDLSQWASANGKELLVVPPFKVEDQVVSSSIIREQLRSGQVLKANQLLNYHYYLESKVVHGKALGRTIGFPTANMVFNYPLLLPAGIYAVKFKLEDGRLLDGVASLGYRPTVEENGGLILETYLFEFDEDIYDQICQVFFVDWLRREEKFHSLDALVQQIKLDIVDAKAVLDNFNYISALDQYLLNELPRA